MARIAPKSAPMTQSCSMLSSPLLFSSMQVFLAGLNVVRHVFQSRAVKLFRLELDGAAINSFLGLAFAVAAKSGTIDAWPSVCRVQSQVVIFAARPFVAVNHDEGTASFLRCPIVRRLDRDAVFRFERTFLRLRQLCALFVPMAAERGRAVGGALPCGLNMGGPGVILAARTAAASCRAAAAASACHANKVRVHSQARALQRTTNDRTRTSIRQSLQLRYPNAPGRTKSGCQLQRAISSRHRLSPPLSSRKTARLSPS